MTKISRNASCPCGSGKKYKRCCLQKDEAGGIDARKPVAPKKIKQPKIGANQFTNSMFIEDDLDLLSNSVVDLIKDGKFAQAEENCKELLSKYPDVVDGFDRFAMLYEARGDKQKAIEYYKKAAEFMETRPGYDREFIADALKKVDELS